MRYLRRCTNINGIVFAALDRSVAGFSPVVWILLGMVFYLYFAMSLLAQIVAKISGIK